MLIERVLAASDDGAGTAGLVVYCEKVRHLVVQQKKALNAFFRPKGHDADYVGAYVGGDSFISSWSVLKRTHAVVILTVDLLLQRLQSGEARLADCSLIVLDECHSATSDHSYNKVRVRV